MKYPLQLLFLTCFLIVGACGLLHHEIWLDEAHAFVLSRDCHSLSDLFHNSTYEGHPLLWNVLLFYPLQLWPKIATMQAIHLFIALLNAAFILNFAPFKSYQKVLLCFSYFLCYEYLVISRDYGLSLFFLMWGLKLFTAPHKNYTWLFICLAALANTHLFSLIISIVLVFLIFLDKQERSAVFAQSKYRVSLLFFVLAALFALYQLKVPSNHFAFSYDTTSYLSLKRMAKAFVICWKGLFHFPDVLTYNNWNSNFLVNHSKSLATIASFGAWLVPYLVLKGDKFAVRLFYFSALIIAASIYLSPIMVSVRHCGFLFMLLVAGYWVKCSNSHPEQKGGGASLVFTLLLVPSVLAAGVMYSEDYHYSFSSGKNVAAYLTKYLEQEKIPLLAQNTSIPVYSAYTGNTAISINSFEAESFCHWQDDPLIIKRSDFLPRVRLYMHKNHLTSVVLLCQDVIPIRFDEGPVSTSLLMDFNTAIVKPECYKVYRIDLN